MKRFITILIILLASTLFGQSYLQKTNEVWNAWKHFEWVSQKRGETTETYFLDVKAEDTLYSKIYLNAPMMSMFATVADSNAANDSIKVEVNLMVSDFSDTTRFVFAKTLTWNQGKTIVSQAFISDVGDWWSNVAATSYPANTYYMLQFIAMTNHRVVNNGVKFRIDTRGNIF